MSILKIAAICTLLTSVAFAGEHSEHNRSDKSEMKKAFETAFKTADTENNGSLNLTEFKAFHSEMEKMREANKPSDEQKFKEIDTDNSGTITKEEMKNHRKENKKDGEKDGKKGEKKDKN